VVNTNVGIGNVPWMRLHGLARHITEWAAESLNRLSVRCNFLGLGFQKPFSRAHNHVLNGASPSGTSNAGALSEFVCASLRDLARWSIPSHGEEEGTGQVLEGC
jgi:hypothetical protein